MTYTDDKNVIFHVSNCILSFINTNIDTYTSLANNYREILNDYDNESRCFEYALTLSMISDHIDYMMNKYDELTVTEIMESNSFIWSLRSYVAKCIDKIMSWGYEYVMRDSAKLRARYKMLVMLYEYINNVCNIYHVYN